MDSLPEDDESVTNSVLEYYKNFSRNPELPKYFSGADKNLTKQNDPSETPSPRIFQVTSSRTEEIENASKVEPGNEKEVEIKSPNSSITSRILEWDSGADIGYGNYHKLYKKSASFPNLLTIVPNLVNIEPDNKTKINEASTSSSSPATEQKIISSTSSSSSKKSPDSSSSSAESSDIKLPIVESMSYIKKRIGVPVAYSTPEIENLGPEIHETPLLRCQKFPCAGTVDFDRKPIVSVRHESRNLNLEIPDKIIEVDDSADEKTEDELRNEPSNSIPYENKKPSVRLQITRPVKIECIDKSKKVVHKDSQTTLNSDKLTVGIQTENEANRRIVADVDKIVSPVSQKIIFLKYNDDESVKSSVCSDKRSDLKVSSSDKTSLESNLGVKSSNDTDTKEASVPSEKTDEKSLADMIMAKHSRDLTEDIRRSLEMLQKLLNTKKYDRATKKHYVKKIVQKIVEGKYSDDSTSSELFRPKKSQAVVPVYRKEKPFRKEPKQAKSDSKLTDTKSSSLRSSPRRLKRFEKLTKTYSRDDLKIKRPSSEQEVIRPVIIEKKNVFPDAFPTDRNYGSSTGPDKFGLSSDDPKSGGDHKSKNWKEEKTTSERLAESRGEGDYLVKVATTERQHQLSWINNEIDHLVKLKGMLEKKSKKNGEDRTESIVSSLANKVHVGDLQGVAETACKSCQKAAPREVPIQTELPTKKLQTSVQKPGSAKVFLRRKANVGTDCKCHQTATHEEKDAQFPVTRLFTCQTEFRESSGTQYSNPFRSREPQPPDSCSCSQTEDLLPEAETSSSCVCCKKPMTSKVQNLLDRLGETFCEPCAKISATRFYPHGYTSPEHNCVCYKLVGTGTMDLLKSTLTQLQRMNIYEQLCEMTGCKCGKKRGCTCAPKKNKNGCAYFLKLEDASSIICECKDVPNKLPEVTVKVPVNRCRRPINCSCSTMTYESNVTSSNSLQDYLLVNYPQFVGRAEQRRITLRDAANEREANAETRKLQFLELFENKDVENRDFCKVFNVFLQERLTKPTAQKPSLFSHHEMREMTRRKCKNLPEMKRKKDENKKVRIRTANRILANTFTKRLQKSTLHGRVDIPSDIRVVTY